MSSNHLYHLGPCYCPNCQDFILHRLNVERPFLGSGPTTPYNLWMDLIKKSRVICGRCGKASKPTKEIKELFAKLKEAKLISLDDEAMFKTRYKEIIKRYGLLNHFTEEAKESIIKEISSDYLKFAIPYEWFENYFYIMLNVVTQESIRSDYLYK